jgi:carbonic anhydrase
VPVHGLLVDIHTGRLEWVVNGYQSLENVTTGRVGELFQNADHALDAFAKIGSATAEELKLPTTKIGELTQSARDWLKKTDQITATVEHALDAKPAAQSAGPPPLPKTPPLPAMPPPIRRR